VWTPAHFDVDDNLRRVARALREVHALPLTGTTYDAVAAARLYARTLSARMSGAAEPRGRSSRAGPARPAPAWSRAGSAPRDTAPATRGVLVAAPSLRTMNYPSATYRCCWTLTSMATANPGAGSSASRCDCTTR
jgi:hypothetical protein